MLWKSKTESNIELLADSRCGCGELPQWDAAHRWLIWTDIPNNNLFRWHGDSGQWEEFYKGRLVGGITLQADDALLLFGENEIFRLRDDGSEEILVRDFDPTTGRVNETIADPEGRVFFGTTCWNTKNPDAEPKPKGALYRLDLDGSVTKIVGGTDCANGMGFSRDGRGFYWSDSTNQTVWRFDYDRATGNLENQRPFLEIPKKEGIPDGMTVDAEDCLWIAFFNGSCVRRYSPDGKLLQKIATPATRPTSCTFGGDDLRDLFITSSGGENKKPQGGTFRIREAGQGVPEFRSRILLGH